MKLINILSLNWFATVGINYKIGGLKAVMSMPVKIYGRLRWNVSGTIVLPEHADRGTLVIGAHHEDYTASAGKAEINIDGVWKIKGVVRIGADCFVGVERNGILEMNDGSFFGRDTQIHCCNDIRFGSNVFAGEMYATDSTVHQIYNGNRKKPLVGSIEVGDGTYLGFRTVLLKGCRIPECSVVASSAVCNRDYTLDGDRNLFLAGVPATVKSINIMATK